jgi:tryptophan synthase beta chain
VILTALCGHGHFDLSAYDQFLNGEMSDSTLSDQDFEAALAALPQMT